MNSKKLQPGLVASYDIRPGNGEGLFWFRSFMNLSLIYLDTYPLRHRLHDTAGCQTGLTTGWMFVYTIQPVVNPV